MDKTYCILRMSDCEAHFGGPYGEKYTASWSEMYSITFPSTEFELVMRRKK